jgi:energy-coupling factor transporter ATP-binding protein EcfA2
MNPSIETGLSWLHTPPSSVPKPPTVTRAQLLPFEELSWQDFEKLCYRLVGRETTIDHCQLYGEPGEEQGGIDIYGRGAERDEYSVYQCKNEKTFGPAKIKRAVQTFLDGEWLSRSDTFVLCTRESLRATKRSKAVEEQSAILKKHGVTLVPWDEGALSSKLKAHPDLVDDFFGRAWVKVFCGDDEADKLGERLDACDLKELRSRLHSIYSTVFNTHDPGIPMRDEVPLVQRYVVPDIEERILTRAYSLPSSQSPQTKGEDSATSSTQRTNQEDVPRRTTVKSLRSQRQRVPIENWISTRKRILLFGDPGSGKSTFLRFLALDLLSDNPRFELIAERWESCVPILIPFALWTKVISQGRLSERSIKDIAVACFKAWTAEDLVPLIERALKDGRLLVLIDGLDEHTSSETADVALNLLEIFLSENDIPVVATTRPHGFEKIQMKTAAWGQARIADLSADQQRALTSIWFDASSARTYPDLEPIERSREVHRRLDLFFSELSRSNELRDLARNPLLLCLLISLQISNVKLPIGRFKAYEKLTDHLLSTHPRLRRVAAETPSQDELPEDDLKKALAFLANTIHTSHPEGLITKDSAEESLIEFLTDNEQGLGMDRASARALGRTVLSHAQDSVGILVKRSQDEVGFYHRTTQEYLVSFHLSRLPMTSQIEIVTSNCTDPGWREIILGLLQITTRPHDVKEFIEHIQAKEKSWLQEKITNDLLSEVAFGSFNSPPALSKKLANYAFKEVELGTWMPYREKILEHALEGLKSSITTEIVKKKIVSWFPGRSGYLSPYVFEAMSKWSIDGDVVDCLFKGLHDESYDVKQAAASTLGKFCKQDSSIASKLIDLAQRTDEPYIMAACMRAFTIGNLLERRDVTYFIHSCASSRFPTMRLAGIEAKIDLGIQDDDDLDNLLRLVDQDVFLSYTYRGNVPDLLLRGWPKSKKVKKICLPSAEHQWYRKGHQVTIDREVAIRVLLQGYPMDEDVVDYCIRELEREGGRFPFLGAHHDAFSWIADNFRDHPRLVAALDAWIEKQDLRDIEASYAALVGRTQAFKGRLISDLDKDSFPHWPARGLLDGWGMSDPEVRSAFLTRIHKSPLAASQIAHLVPRIVSDKDKAREILVDCLNSDNDRIRYDFVLSGLVDLGVSSDDTPVVDRALEILSATPEGLFIDGFRDGLIRNYGFDPRVRRLALDSINTRGGSYNAVAQAFGEDKEIRNKLLSIATPLPAGLRKIIALTISNTEVDDSFATSVLRTYDLEKDEEVKVQSAIGYYTKLKLLQADATSELTVLSREINCAGPDHIERAQAAFCGLSILGRLDIMRDMKAKYGDKKVAVDASRGINRNVPFIRFLLKHWEMLQKFFKEEFWERIFHYSSNRRYVWNILAPFADQYPVVKSQLLEFLHGQTEKLAQLETLAFLSRVQPNSNLLEQYCLNTLNLGENPNLRDTNISPRDKLAAAHILAENFSHNAKILNTIVNSKPYIWPNEYILLLSEGWSKSNELQEALKELARKPTRCWESTALTYYSFLKGRKPIFLELRRVIRINSSHAGYGRSDETLKPIIRRVSKDDQLLSYLIRYLRACSCPSEKISIAKIVFESRGPLPRLQDWARQELRQQLLAKTIEVGYDITSGEFMSVPHALYEILLPRLMEQRAA